MKILVTGSSGYVGSALATILEEWGHEVVRMDIKDGQDILEAPLPEVDAVAHLAAIVGEAACQDQPIRAQAVNVEGTRRLVTHYRDIPFVYMDTCSVYGASGKLCTEDDPVRPLGLYAETKLQAEALVLQAGGVVLRCGTIFGIGKSAAVRYDLYVNEIARAAARNEPFEVYQPNAVRPWLHIEDVCTVIELFARSFTPEVDGGRIYNVVGENLTKQGVVELVRWWEPHFEVRYGGKPDDRDYGADGTRLRMRFPHLPQFVSVGFGIKEIFNACS